MNTRDKSSVRLRYQILFRPSRDLSDLQFQVLTEKIAQVGFTCFEALPQYQVFISTREAFDNKVIALAWDGDQIAGFCSGVILDVSGVGNVLHLGLTCISPQYRSFGLTHKLTSKVITHYLWHSRSFFKPIWISNCAAVLGSLVNVGLYFGNVYPSPFGKMTYEHLTIASVVEKRYRAEIYIHKNVKFSYADFVFRGSVKGTVFSKLKEDRRYYHRDEDLNNYYIDIIDFSRGDEILQIGTFSLKIVIQYSAKRVLASALKKMRNSFKPLRTSSVRASS